jgi:thiol-disulfide isomerase/thioredoxin
MVSRLSKGALQKIMGGKVKEETTVAIQFYGNNCSYCHALKDHYEEVADEYEDIIFFAFNVQDYPGVEEVLNFRGVPTICLMKVGGTKPKIRIMPEPPQPHHTTWYTVPEIKSFIEKEK